MLPSRKAIAWIFAAIELPWVVFWGHVAGITWLVRYLRNPNPLLTPIVLRTFGARIGKRTKFKRSVFLDNAFEDQNSAGDFSYLKIGNNCFLGDSVVLDLSNEIMIEDNAVISGRVAILTHADCNRSPFLNEHFPRMSRPVIVGSGAWLGFGATVLAGIAVGREAVVAAGALVNADVPERTLVAGVPAEVKRKIGPSVVHQ